MARGEIALSMTAEMIILIIGFLTVLIVIFASTDISGKTITDKVCEDSIALRAQKAYEINDDSSILGTEKTKLARFALAPLLCKTQDKKYPEEKKKGLIYIPEKQKRQGAKLVQNQLAEDIASCWKMTGQGRFSPLFDAIETGTESQCFVCYDFTSKIPLNREGGSADIIGYMRENKYIEKPTKEQIEANPNLENQKDVTYFDYITRTGGCGYLLIPGEQIEANKRYGITYVGPRANFALTQNIVGHTAGGILGGILGAKAATGAVMIIYSTFGFAVATQATFTLAPAIVVGGILAGGYVGDDIANSIGETYEEAVNIINTWRGKQDHTKACAGIVIQPVELINDNCFIRNVPKSSGGKSEKKS